MFNQQQIYLFSQIQTSLTGGQLYSDTSPYKVSECSLLWESRVLEAKVLWYLLQIVVSISTFVAAAASQKTKKMV